jgi:hypothetical protein
MSVKRARVQVLAAAEGLLAQTDAFTLLNRGAALAAEGPGTTSMPGGPHKQQSQKTPRPERRERLAQELRSNLLKRKALARARRRNETEPGQESCEASGDTGNREASPKLDHDLTQS